MIVTRKMAEEACKVLGWGVETLNAEMTSEGVGAQYRQAAKAAHPDAGGSAEAFAAVDRAKHVLLAWLKRQSGPMAELPHGDTQQCYTCEGRGYLVNRRGWKVLHVQCHGCGGSGELGIKVEKGE